MLLCGTQGVTSPGKQRDPETQLEAGIGSLGQLCFASVPKSNHRGWKCKEGQVCGHNQPHDSHPHPGCSWAVNESYVMGRSNLGGSGIRLFTLF